MTAVRSYLILWGTTALQTLGLFFTWLMAKVKDPKPTPKKTATRAVSDAPRVVTEPPAVPRPAPVVVVPPCEVCGTPSTGLRSHDGHWRCLAHKGVTCDVCGRAVVMPKALPDQAWTCATHG